MNIKELLDTHKDSKEIINRLKYNIHIINDMEVSAVISTVQKYIDTESKQKTVYQDVYLGELSDLVSSISYTFTKSLDDLETKIHDYIDSNMKYIRTQNINFEEFFLCEEGEIHGRNKVLESTEQFETRKQRLHLLQNDINTLQGYLNADAFEVELQALKLKYGK